MAEVPLHVRVVMDSAAIKSALLGIQRETKKAERGAQQEITETERMRTRSFMRNRTQVTQMFNHLKQESRRSRREIAENIFLGFKNGINRSRNFLRANRGAFALGAGAAGVELVRSTIGRTQKYTGLPTTQDAHHRARDFELKFGQLASAAKMSPEAQGKLRERILGVSATKGREPLEIVSAFQQQQTTFGRIDLLDQNLELVADAANTTGEAMGGFAAIVGEMNKQFGLEGKQLTEGFGMVAEATNMGAIEFADFNNAFRAQMGPFVSTTGITGMPALAQMLGISESLGQTFNPAMAAQRFGKGVTSLKKPDARRKLDRRINTRDEFGFDVTMDIIAERMNEANLQYKDLFEIFGDDRTIKFWQAIMKDMREGRLAEIVQGADFRSGISRVESGSESFLNTPVGRMQANISRRLRSGIKNFEELFDWAEKWGGSFEKFKEEHPVGVEQGGVILDAAWKSGVIYFLRQIMLNTTKLGGLQPGVPGPGGKVPKGGKLPGAKGGRGLKALGLGTIGWPLAAITAGTLAGEAFPDLGGDVNDALGFPLLSDRRKDNVMTQEEARAKGIDLSQLETASRKLEKAAVALDRAGRNIARSGKHGDDINREQAGTPPLGSPP